MSVHKQKGGFTSLSEEVDVVSRGGRDSVTQCGQDAMENPPSYNLGWPLPVLIVNSKGLKVYVYQRLHCLRNGNWVMLPGC